MLADITRTFTGHYLLCCDAMIFAFLLEANCSTVYGLLPDETLPVAQQNIASVFKQMHFTLGSQIADMSVEGLQPTRV